MPEDAIRLRSLIALFGFAVLGGVQADAQVNVTPEHNNASSNGVYGGRGHATYTYQICNAGTQTCSNQVTVTFWRLATRPAFIQARGDP